MNIEIIPVPMNKEVEEGDDIVQLMLISKTDIQNNDVIVFTQKIISKQEGRLVDLDSITPSILAIGIASEYNRDPRLVQVILNESSRIVRMNNGLIISETPHGFVCANAGVDESNVKNGYATLLPEDPNKSAERLRGVIKEQTGKNVSVIISDTFGRPFRLGQINIAIGFSGMSAITDYVGVKDNFGRTMRVTEIATVDEISSASELAMKKTLHVPIVILRNYQLEEQNHRTDIIRPKSEDLFR